MIFSKTDHEVMTFALELANKGRYYVQPNPMVGCVITDKNNEIIASGFHQQYGNAHAEVNALADLAQSTNILPRQTLKIFITLEPCCHQGKTPACVDVIIDSGIKTVIIAMLDPNPNVSGKGVELLKAQGIKVLVGLQAQQARQLNQVFIKAMTEKLPFVTCKVGMSLDGKTAMNNGQSKWITSKESRLDGQRLRMTCDAIVTGSGTVLADNPHLTVRLPDVLRPPIRIVLDTQAKIQSDANIFSDHAPSQHYTKHNAVLNQQGSIDLKILFAQLYRQGICHILLEAGAKLVGSMLTEQLIDEFVFYSAPLIMGSQAKSAIALPVEQLEEAVRLNITQVRPIGQDLKIIATPLKSL